MEACKEEDHISLLPDHILAFILSYLPISHAAQTSVLSKRWAHVWKSTPSISFRRDLQSESSAFLLARRSNLKRLALDVARQVDCVFEAHAGRVSACEIVHSKFNPMSDIERWIQQLSRRRIQRLALICRRERTDRYRAWPFMEEEQQQQGEEQGVLESARPFAGCVHLTTLRLDSVHLSGKVLADIIRCCVALERLVLCDCLGLSAITIHSATLKGLELKKLATGSVDVRAKSLDMFSICDSSSSAVANSNIINNAVWNCPHLERMSLQNCDLDSLRIRPSNLKSLDLRMLRIKGDIDIDAPRLASLRMSDVNCTGLFDIATPNLQSLSSRYGVGTDKDLRLKNVSAYQSNADLFARCAHLFGKSPPEAVGLHASTPFDSLNNLSINLDLNDLRSAIVLAYLLKICPHLQELIVLIENGTQGQNQEIFKSPICYSDKRHNESPYWEGQDAFCYITHQLKTVELRGFTGRLLELDFARFVIRRAVVLRTMTVECCKGLSKEGKRATRLLKSLPRASLDARVIIKRTN